MSVAAPERLTVCPGCGEEIVRRSRSGVGLVVKARIFRYEPCAKGKLRALLPCPKCGTWLRLRKSTRGSLRLLFAPSSLVRVLNG